MTIQDKGGSKSLKTVTGSTLTPETVMRLIDENLSGRVEEARTIGRKRQQQLDAITDPKMRASAQAR